jgi:hypothetical protein
MKIRCKKTEEVYDAVDAFSEKPVYKLPKTIYGEISEEEFIEKHNKYISYMKERKISTVRVPWDETTPEEKESLLKLRFKQTIGYETIEVENERYHIGYFVNSDTGGNMDKGWFKIFNKDDVEIVND